MAPIKKSELLNILSKIPAISDYIDTINNQLKDAVTEGRTGISFNLETIPTELIRSIELIYSQEYKVLKFTSSEQQGIKAHYRMRITLQ